jgi:hypothetical protein
MSHPGIFAEQVDRGFCPECGEWRCECNGEEPIYAAHQNRLDAWVNADTGRIITEAQAKDLLGRSGRAHADKCKCRDCEEYRNAEDPREWGDV